MIKKISFLLAALLLFSAMLAGCGGEVSGPAGVSAPESESKAESEPHAISKPADVSEPSGSSDPAVSSEPSGDESSEPVSEPEPEDSSLPDETEIGALPRKPSFDETKLLSMSSDEIAEKIVYPAIKAYECVMNPYDVFTYVTDDEMTPVITEVVNGDKYEWFMTVIMPETFDGCVAFLRQYFSQELINEFISERCMVDLDGRAGIWCVSAESDITYETSRFEFIQADLDRGVAFLKITSCYIKDEYFDKEDFSVDAEEIFSPEYTNSYSVVLKMVREDDGNWIFTGFLHLWNVLSCSEGFTYCNGEIFNEALKKLS